MFKKFLVVFSAFYILFFVFGIGVSVSAEELACQCADGQWTSAGSTPDNCQSKCRELGNLPPYTCKCSAVGSLANQQTPAVSVTLTNPLGSITSPQTLIGKIINAVLGVVGSIALLMFVYGGLVWMTSAGSSEKVKQGREIIVWSAIGLAIIFAAYGMVRILISAVQ